MTDLSLSATYATHKLSRNVPLNSRAKDIYGLNPVQRCYRLFQVAQGIVTATLPGGEGLKARQVSRDPR